MVQKIMLVELLTIQQTEPLVPLFAVTRARLTILRQVPLQGMMLVLAR
jgi:hypothetical protein